MRATVGGLLAAFSGALWLGTAQDQSMNPYHHYCNRTVPEMMPFPSLGRPGAAKGMPLMTTALLASFVGR